MLHLKEHLFHIKNGTCLDIGTRFGEFAFTLAEALPDSCQIIGIDCNEDAVKQANEKNTVKNVEFQLGDAEHLDYKDNSCELVAISNTLHHIKNYDAVLDEMIRVLRPNGTFIVNEMYSDNQNEKQQTHFAQHSLEAKLDRLSGKFQRETWKRSEIINILSRLPLEHVKLIDMLETPETDAKLALKTPKLKPQIEKLAKGSPEYEELIKEADRIEKRVSEIGIQRCTQLIYIGKKI